MLMTLALVAAMVFPNLQVRDLDGRNMMTREALREPTVLLIGFTYASRGEVEAWEKWISAETQGALRTVEMPIYSGVAALARPMIEAGMARQTPKAMRPFVWGSTDRNVLLQALKLTDPDRAAVIVLVDASGQVRCLERGAPNEESRQSIMAAWRQVKLP